MAGQRDSSPMRRPAEARVGALRVVAGGHVVVDLLIIGLAITLMPVTIVAFGLIVSARKGLWKGLAFIGGWLTCIVAIVAVVILFTGGKPPRPHTAPSNAALLVKAAIGAVLIWVGFRLMHRMGQPDKP